MKTEQMPERIAILTPPGMTEVDFQYFWPTKPCPGGEHVVKGTGHDYAEYVRADAVLGDPNEPLADGQWRWAKQYDHDEWEVWGVELICKKMKLVWPGAMLAHLPETFYEIGPVIRPPADTAN